MNAITLSNEQIRVFLDKLKKPIQEQVNQKIYFIEYSDDIRNSINDLVNKYGDIKTILTIEELLRPSDQPRSKDIPRPQNIWVLYRKDISKGIKKANIKSFVGRTSKVAADLYKNTVSEREKEFWMKLSLIDKKIHFIKYPYYKYSPNRNKKKEMKVLRNSADNLYNPMITTNINQNPTYDTQNLTYQQSISNFNILDELLIDPLLLDNTALFLDDALFNL